MKVNKLKLAALAMSAITCATSIPNVAFAEDFAAAFTSEAEAVDTFSADEEAVAGDSFDLFLFDSGEVMADNPAIDLDQASITFYYDDANNSDTPTSYPDGTVTYLEYDLSAGDGTSKTYVMDVDGKTPKLNVLEGVATKTNEQDADCVNAATFQYTYTIPGYEKYGAFLSKVFEVAGSTKLGHDWVALDKLTPITYADCSSETDGTGYQDYRCSRCGKLESEVPEDQQTSTGFGTEVPLPFEHVWGEELTRYEVNGTEVTDPSKYDSYTIVTYHICQVCGKEEIVETTDFPTPAGYAIISFPDDSNIDPDFQNKMTYPVEYEDNEIVLVNCAEVGKYNIDYYDGEDHLVASVPVEVAKHHSPGEIRVVAADGKRWESANGKSPAEDGGTTTGIDELAIQWNDDGTVKSVVSKSCWEDFTYSIVCYCHTTEKTVDNETKEWLHEYDEPQKDLTAVHAGPHSYKELTDAQVQTLITELDTTKIETINKNIADGKKAEPYKYIKLSTTATCGVAGELKVTYLCRVCGAEAKTSDAYDVPALSHIDKDPVIENSKAATCTAEGSVDTVVYCDRCGVERSRITTTLQKTPHKYLSEKDDYSNIGFEWQGQRVIGGYHYDAARNTDTAYGLMEKFPFTIEGDVYSDSTDFVVPESTFYFNEDSTVRAYLYDVCTICGEKEALSAKDFNNDVTITVNSLSKQGGKYCEEGIINLSAVFEKTVDGTTYSKILEAKDFPYYSSYLTFQGRTQHVPGETKTTVITEPTETEEGVYEEVVLCKYCGYEISRELYESSPTGHKHNMTHVPGVAADCKTGTEGVKEHWVCDSEVCAGKYYADENGETQLSDIVIKPTHDTELVKAVAATCVEDGVKAHYVCSVCGKLFQDEDGTIEITKEDTVDAATGEHTPNDAVVENFVEAQPFTSGSYENVVYCEVCKEEISRDIVTIPATRKPYATAVLGLHSNIYPETETARIYFTAQDGVDDYRINYRIAGTGSAGYDAVDGGRVRTDGANDYVVSGLKKGALYDFRVAAGNYVDGDENDVVWGTRSGYNRRWMQTVETVNIKAGTGSITVQWVEPTSATPSKYVVYYAPNKDMSGQKSVTVKGGTNTVTISGLEKGTRYYVRIRPYAQESKKTYSGSLSNRVSAKVK